MSTAILLNLLRKRQEAANFSGPYSAILLSGCQATYFPSGFSASGSMTNFSSDSARASLKATLLLTIWAFWDSSNVQMLSTTSSSILSLTWKCRSLTPSMSLTKSYKSRSMFPALSALHRRTAALQVSIDMILTHTSLSSDFFTCHKDYLFLWSLFGFYFFFLVRGTRINQNTPSNRKSISITIDILSLRGDEARL